MPDTAPRPKRFSMLRSLVLADFITLANGACGTGAIFCCLNAMTDTDSRWLWGAFVLLPLALIFDMADGFVARWRHKHSPYGADLDSLADVISFGVAPAVLAFTVGMRGLWDAVVLIGFVACGIARLARFNATLDELTTAEGKVSHYEGTPIPTSLGLVLMLFVAWKMGAVHGDLWLGSVELPGGQLHPLVLAWGISGSLMVSTFPIPKP